MTYFEEADRTCANKPLTYNKFINDLNYIRNDIISPLPNR